MSAKLIFLGPPGAGKGTLSSGVTDELGIVQISTGDLLRAAIAGESRLGVEARRYIDQGHLVPDDLILGIMDARLQQADCANGYILDGFPRTIPQAQALEDKGIDIDLVIHFLLDDDTIIQRLSGRRLHRVTGNTYNVNPGGFPPPPEGTDPSDLIQRDDDRPEAIAKRLLVYRKQTAPLIEFYDSRGVLKTVDVDRPMDQILPDVMALIRAI
jgi:adenylate kinase